MERRTALIGAALLTGVMALALLIMGATAGARAAEPLAGAAAPAAIAAQSTTTPASEYEAALAAREAALLEQVALRRTAIADLDAGYAAQFDALEKRLAATNDALLDASGRIDAVGARADGVRNEIAATDQAFQTEMAGLQAGLTNQDAQIRLEIESIYAQLQQAYDQLAAQQASAAQASNGGGGGGGGSSSAPVVQPGDDHNGDDHNGDDHEDDSHEGDSHEGDSHDD